MEQLDQIKKKQDRFELLNAKLKSAGFFGCFSEHVNLLEEKKVKGFRKYTICSACGENISYENRWKIRYYGFCEQCKMCKNNESDYETAFYNVSEWMGNFAELKGRYPIRISINNIPWCKYPIKRKKSYILCKRFMKRNCIAFQMVYAYVDLWIKENIDKVLTPNRKRLKLKKISECNRCQKRDDCGVCDKYELYKKEIICRWYMIQYLYAIGEENTADEYCVKFPKSIKQYDEFQKLIKAYPFYIPGRYYDEREAFKTLLHNHPLSDLI